MSLVQSGGISRWHLGFGAVTGAVYYFTNASNRQHFQNYCYHMVSNVFAELSHVNIMVLVAICFISFTKLNHSMFGTLSNTGILWTRPVINAIFLCLRCISALKVVIAVLRGLIKTRKFSQFQNRSLKLHSGKEKYQRSSSHYINTKCVICLEEFLCDETPQNECPSESNREGETSAIGEKKKILLECNHVFHSRCFKDWYVVSGDCPYCRSKVDL